MRMLGSATAAGLSLETALTETMQLHVNTMTRRRLLRWRAAIESGATVDEAARRASLPRLVSGMLATVRKTNQLPRAIEYLGRYYEDKFSRAAALAGGAVVPAIELFFGVLVAWIALAAITPLFTLLNALTGGGT
jgi:type II secretory pathway component PulF